MKAALFRGGSKGFEVSDVPDPIAERGGVVLKVEAAAICGTDLKIIRNVAVKLKGQTNREIPLPRILGHELAGTIVAVGADVKGFQVGQRVTVAPSIPCGRCVYCARGRQEMCANLKVVGYDIDGAFAQYMKVPSQAIRAGCVNLLPGHLTTKVASLVEPLSCVLHGLEQIPVYPGDAVAILGAGPIGCFFAELTRQRGAGKVILAQRSLQRLKLARMAEADIYISALEEDVVRRVLDETDGRGADLVITAAPTPEPQQQALEMVSKCGRVNFFVGLPRDQSPLLLDSNLIHYKECLVGGTHGSSPRHNREALDLLASGDLDFDKYITHYFALERIGEAYATADSSLGMKVLVLPWKEI